MKPLASKRLAGQGMSVFFADSAENGWNETIQESGPKAEFDGQLSHVRFVASTAILQNSGHV